MSKDRLKNDAVPTLFYVCQDISQEIASTSGKSHVSVDEQITLSSEEDVFELEGIYNIVLYFDFG